MNPLTLSIVGLYKTAVIRRRGARGVRTPATASMAARSPCRTPAPWSLAAHRRANTMRVCSPASRRLAPLRPRGARLSALTPAPRTLVQIGPCRRCPLLHPLQLVGIGYADVVEVDGKRRILPGPGLGRMGGVKLVITWENVAVSRRAPRRPRLSARSAPAKSRASAATSTRPPAGPTPTPRQPRPSFP